MNRPSSTERTAEPAGVVLHDGVCLGWAEDRRTDAAVIELRPGISKAGPTVGRSVTVRVMLTVEVDPDTWAADFGSDGDHPGDHADGHRLEQSHLREDVRRYVGGLVAGSEAMRRGALTQVVGRGRRTRGTGDY